MDSQCTSQRAAAETVQAGRRCTPLLPAARWRPLGMARRRRLPTRTSFARSRDKCWTRAPWMSGRADTRCTGCHPLRSDRTSTGSRAWRLGRRPRARCRSPCSWNRPRRKNAPLRIARRQQTARGRWTASQRRSRRTRFRSPISCPAGSERTPRWPDCCPQSPPRRNRTGCYPPVRAETVGIARTHRR